MNWVSEHFGANIPLLVSASGLPDNTNTGLLGDSERLQTKLQYINEAMKGEVISYYCFIKTYMVRFLPKNFQLNVHPNLQHQVFQILL